MSIINRKLNIFEGKQRPSFSYKLLVHMYIPNIAKCITDWILLNCLRVSASFDIHSHILPISLLMVETSYKLPILSK